MPEESEPRPDWAGEAEGEADEEEEDDGADEEAEGERARDEDTCEDEDEGGMVRARLVMMSMRRALDSWRTWSACVRMRCAKSFTTCSSTKCFSCRAPTSLAASSTLKMLFLHIQNI